MFDRVLHNERQHRPGCATQQDKNEPGDVHARLKEWALLGFRSVESLTAIAVVV